MRAKTLVFNILMFLLTPVILVAAIILIESISFVIHNKGFQLKQDSHSGAINLPLYESLNLYWEVVTSVFANQGRLIPIENAGKIIEEKTYFIRRARKESYDALDLNEKVVATLNQEYSEDGSRTTIYRHDNRDFSKHLILLGGSYAYGHGLNNEDMLTSALSKHLPSFELYNYGFPGAGLPTALSLLLEENFSERISHKNGIVIYLWLPFHFHRILGVPDNYAWYSSYHYFNFIENDQLGYAHTHHEGAPFTARINSLISTSYFMKVIGKNTMTLFNDKTVEKLTCALFKSMKAQIKKKLPASKLVVVPFEGQFTRDFLPKCLKGNKIDTLLFDPIDAEEKRPLYLFDGHPSAIHNDLLAEKIVSGLKDNYPEVF